MEFSKWLKEERLNQGLKQLDLAKISGVNNNTISNCERGLFNISLFNAEILAEALGYELVPVKRKEKKSGSGNKNN